MTRGGDVAMTDGATGAGDRPPTVIDVARRAGVSTATVSRVLNGTAEVRDETRRAVLAAVSVLDYRPNPLARDLRSARTHRILVVFPELRSPVLSTVFEGIGEVARSRGYFTLLSPTDGDPNRERELLELVSNRSVDAALCIGSSLPDDEFARLGTSLPLVQCLEWSKGAPVARVSIDDRRAAEDLTNHLLTIGHRRIAFLGNASTRPGRLREQGFRDALRAAGIALDESLFIDGDYGYDHGRDGMRVLARRAEPPTAILGVSDVIAAGAVTEARVLGMSIPGDIAVAGFDDSRESTMSVPPITTVRQPFADIGRRSMRILLRNLDHPGDRVVDHMVVHHELVIRESTIGVSS